MRKSTLLGISLFHLALWTCPGALVGQEIQRSIAFPVTNQTVTFTVPGLGEGGIINITSSQGITTQLVVNAQEQVTWTPSRYGKYTLSAGTTTDTMWVTVRPMKFHWWSCTTEQKNVTEVMQTSAAWTARGVTQVAWTGGEAYSRGVDGLYWTTANDWYNGWSYAYGAGGMALDEIFCQDVAPTPAITDAVAMVRQARGPAYSINVWIAGFGSNFAAGAAKLKASNATILLEDYYGTWNLHKSRWDSMRSYGLQNQAISGIWPGTQNLTNEAEIRTDVALVRLAAPEANGIAMFAPTDQNYTPKDLPTVLRDCDKAIEDYYLKPLIHLSVTSSAQVDVWNLGNDDATGFTLQLLNSSLGVVQTIDLSMLSANGHRFLSWPAGVVYAKVINPPGTANLYVGNSQYSNGLYRLYVPGRYTFTNANGDNLWSTFSAWDPHGPPPGNIDSGNSAYFDGSPISVTAAGGETSIGSVQFVNAGWTINGNPTSQDFFTYGITSAGAGTNTIKIGYRTTAGVSANFNAGSGNTVVMDGLISGPGGLAKQGPGTLKLTWNNSYTGTTSVNAGNLICQAPGNADWTLPTGSKTVASGTTMKVDLTPQSPTQYRKTNLGSTAINAGGVLDLYSTEYHLNSWHLINSWAATGSGTIRLTGGGAVSCWTGSSNALSGFTGLLDIQNGQFAVNIDSTSTLGGTPDVNLNAAGTLDMRTGQFAIDALDGEPGSQVLKSWNTAVTLTVGNANGSGNFAGTISNANGTIALTKVGNGTQTLSGSNSFTGTTTINSGTLALSGGSAIVDSGAVTLANTAGAQLRLNTNETIGSLTGGGPTGGNVNLQGNTLTVGNASSTTFAGSLSGPGGLTKAGTGTLALTGTNTYTGNTTVNAGTLSLSSASLSDGSTVTVATGAVLDLNTGESDTVGGLVLGGVTVPVGTYNATHPDYGSYFTGTGSLIVSTAYNSWTSSNGLSGGDLLPAADPDHDGLANAIEFVLGGEPNPANANSNSGALLPTVDQTATDVVFTFPRSDAANAMPGIGINAEFGSNLTDWTPAEHGVNGVTITETNNGFGPGVDKVDVSIPKPLVASSNVFVRLKVTLP